MTGRVRTPTVLQLEAVESGAAALSIVLSYHGRFIPLEELRTACGVSRDGSKASSLVKAARSYGLVSRGYQKETGALGSLPLPLIAFWSFSHFVVVEGLGRRKVYLNDPATGPRTVSREEFEQGYTGVALAFWKTERFAPGGSRPSAWRSLARRLPQSRVPLLFLALCTLALVLPGVIAPVYARVFLDNILIADSLNWLNPLLAAMALTACVIVLLGWLQSDLLLRLHNRLGLTSTSRFLWHVLQLPMEFFAQRNAGDVCQRIEGNNQVAALLSGGLSITVVNLATIGFYAYLMFRYDVRLAAIGAAIALLNLALLRLVSRARTIENRRLALEQGKLSAVAVTGLQMLETLKATAGEHGFFSRWAGFQAKALNSSRELAESSLLLSTAPVLLGAVNAAAILGLGGLHIIDGALTMGMFVAFQMLMAAFLRPVTDLLDLGSNVQNLQGTLTRLDEVLAYPADPKIFQAESEEGHLKLEGEIELRNVTFGYSRLDPPVVRNFNLHVKPGQRVAIVGGTGSGKSTVARIISGLYQPWEGEVLFDGKPRNDLPRSLITNSVALVDQEIALFEGTVRQNLTMWDSTIEDRVVLQAAKDACIHDDISERPGGYDLKIEEGGRNLSGGQRQRIDLARALTGNPRILILDEATSALDPRLEKAVDDNLRRRGSTLLIIAHRVSAIRDCDEIVVLQNGKIVQRGTHDAMIHGAGPYSALIQASS